MNVELIYNAKVSPEGIMTIQNRSAFNKELELFAGKEVEVIVKRKRSKRSNPQNRYFHGVAIPIIKHRLLELGFDEAHSNEWVKDFVKFNCLKIEVTNPDTGEVMETLGKTSGLTKSEFADMVERLERFCAEKLDIQLPMPGEVITLNFN